MSEQILIKKKKKTMLSIEEAIKILKPFIKQWQRQDEEMANKMYEVYQQCKWGDWTKVLKGLNFPSRTWYNWVEHFGFDTNFPQTTDNWEEKPAIQQASDAAEYEDEVIGEFDTAKYQETYSILKNAQRLNLDMFKVVEKKDLIEELQHTIKKLTTLLLKLESNIDEE